MNIFKRIIYFFLSIKEKTLLIRLDKHLKPQAKNLTSKTILSSGETMTLNAQTEKNKELVKKNVEELLKNTDPHKFLAYIQSKGTRICKLRNADKILSVIKEEEGLIPELRGFEAFYLNVMTNSGFSFKTKPMFVMRNGEIDPYYMIHQFYKWYAMEYGLPGFDYVSQKLFKKHLKNPEGMGNLSLDEMLGLQEAIARDKEATQLAYDAAKAKEGGKKAFDKLNDGGANI